MDRDAHEQMGLFLKGTAELTMGGRKEVLKLGAIYLIERDEENGVNNTGRETAVYVKSSTHQEKAI
mgnify:CR=1 FL=1